MEKGKYQVTLFCDNGKYKPISCIVTTKEDKEKMEIVNQGIIKICQKRYWKNADRKKYGYNIAKIRKIDIDNE